MEQRRKNRRPLLTLIGLIIVVGIGVIAFQFVTKTGIFKVPGVVYYEDSLTEEEKKTLADIFTDEIVLDKDVHISAKNYLEKPETKEGDYIYKISVPVVDFYNPADNIEVDAPEDLFNDSIVTDVDFEMIDLDDLTFAKRLININDKYYLDDFNSGAVFRIISFDSDKYTDEIKPLVEEKFSKTYPEKNNVLTFAQTGVTALSRGMNKKLDEVGDAKYFATEIGDYLSGFDLTHTSNESSFSDYASSENICSKPEFINTLLAIGLDIVELTGNHNQDCGDTAAKETIDIYSQNDIKIVGGGKTAKAAAEPLKINQKGSNITFLAYNESTGGATLDDTPGANQYSEENATQEITAAKEQGDLVIVDIQYYECSAYVSETEDATCDYANSSAGDQVGFFRHLIDLGADVVVGTSAHQPQTYELYGDGVIYYGLGNLFFDQAWWPGTTRSLILAHHIYNGKLLQTEIVPTAYDNNYQTKLMDADSSKWYIERLASARPRY